MAVCADSSSSVMSRCRRSARSRGPAAVMASSRSPSMVPMLPQRQRTLPDSADPAHGRRGGGRDDRVDGQGRRRGDRRRSGGVERGADAGPGAAIGGGDRRRGSAQRAGRRRARAAGPRGAHRPASCSRGAGRRSGSTAGGSWTGTVAAAVRAGDGFAVTLVDGRSVRARRLLVTTGLVDELPDVAGLRERWGRDVLHCPYCHGWRSATRPSACSRAGRCLCTRRCCSGSGPPTSPTSPTRCRRRHRSRPSSSPRAASPSSTARWPPSRSSTTE